MRVPDRTPERSRFGRLSGPGRGGLALALRCERSDRRRSCGTAENGRSCWDRLRRLPRGVCRGCAAHGGPRRGVILREVSHPVNPRPRALFALAHRPVSRDLSFGGRSRPGRRSAGSGRRFSAPRLGPAASRSDGCGGVPEISGRRRGPTSATARAGGDGLAGRAPGRAPGGRQGSPGAGSKARAEARAKARASPLRRVMDRSRWPLRRTIWGDPRGAGSGPRPRPRCAPAPPWRGARRLLLARQGPGVSLVWGCGQSLLEHRPGDRLGR